MSKNGLNNDNSVERSKLINFSKLEEIAVKSPNSKNKLDVVKSLEQKVDQFINSHLDKLTETANPHDDKHLHHSADVRQR